MPPWRQVVVAVRVPSKGEVVVDVVQEVDVAVVLVLLWAVRTRCSVTASSVYVLHSGTLVHDIVDSPGWQFNWLGPVFGSIFGLLSGPKLGTHSIDEVAV